MFDKKEHKLVYKGNNQGVLDFDVLLNVICDESVEYKFDGDYSMIEKMFTFTLSRNTAALCESLNFPLSSTNIKYW